MRLASDRRVLEFENVKWKRPRPFLGTRTRSLGACAISYLATTSLSTAVLQLPV